MEKIIKLIMCSDKSVKILVNGKEKHTIEKDNRNISANEIFEIMDFELGDYYEVQSENEAEADVPVLEFFAGLISEIAEKVNQINAITEESSEDTDEALCN